MSAAAAAAAAKAATGAKAAVMGAAKSASTAVTGAAKAAGTTATGAKAAVMGAAKSASTAVTGAAKAAGTTATAAVRRIMSIPSPPEVPAEMMNLKAKRMTSEGNYKPFDPNVAALILDEKLEKMDYLMVKYHGNNNGSNFMFFGTGLLSLFFYQNTQYLKALEKEFAEDK